MSTQTPSGIAAGRNLWVGLGLIVLVLLGVTVPLSAASVDDAETAARERSVRVVREVLAAAVTPELVASDIVADDRRVILELVRTRILADDRFARVLIWKPDGELLFSSVSPTHVAVIGEESDLVFAQAIGGVPSSVVVDATETTVAFHRTFVPLEALGATDAYAVVEVDQRYDPLYAEATERWRVAQVVLGSSFGVLVVLLAISSVGGAAPRRVRRRHPSARSSRSRRSRPGSRTPSCGRSAPRRSSRSPNDGSRTRPRSRSRRTCSRGSRRPRTPSRASPRNASVRPRRPAGSPSVWRPPRPSSRARRRS